MLDIANALKKISTTTTSQLEKKIFHLGPRIYVVVMILQKDEDETRFLVVFQFRLDYFADYIQTLLPFWGLE